MTAGSRAASGVVLAGIAATCLVALAACSTVTYGTGVSTTTQTLQDMTRMLGIFDLNREFIEYQARPNLVIPQTATLPEPGTGTPAAAWPQTPTLPNAGPGPCAAGPGDPAPPAQYCTPNPNAPAVVMTGGGLFGGAPAPTEVRRLANPCQWWQVTWNQMNAAEQVVWGRLGWNAGNWGTTNTALWPDSAGKLWRNLRGGERGAAESLGFNETIWNSCYL